MHMGDEASQEEWEWGTVSAEEPFQCLLIKNAPNMRCIACGALSLRDWMLSFRERDAPEDGKELVFCSSCWKGLLETGIRLYLRLTKGKCKVQGVTVPKDWVAPLVKELE